MSPQPGRNDPCSCGSGKKYKKCCEAKIALRSPMPQAETAQLVALFHAGRYVELESQTQLLLKRYPDSGFMWKLLGVSLGLQGKNALAALKMAAGLLPHDAEVHYNLGVALQDLGQPHDALASYQRALALNLNDADVHNKMGNVLQEIGQFDDAAVSYRRALALKPDFVEAHNKLGSALYDLWQFENAAISCRRALVLKPDYADAHNNLGLALQSLGQPEAALAGYRQALSFKPNFTAAHNNLGNVLQDLGQLDDAVASFDRALALNPNYAEAHGNLGNALKELGQFDNALLSYRRALELKPDFVDARGNYLFALNYTATHASDYCLEEARQYGRMAAKQVGACFSNWKCIAEPQRLRVGLVSGDLRRHPVSYALESLLSRLDPSRIELIAYSTTHKVDELTARIKPIFSVWKPLFAQDDKSAANVIHADGVHVLLDLSGHTGHNRLSMFAWRPAPVQASWLGYFATTGVVEMDYLLTSEVAVPEEQCEHFTESVWYLPDIWLCFTPPEFDLPVTPLPALDNGYLTFGCFQRLDKMGDRVISAWGKIFAALPDARLRIAGKQLRDPEIAAQLLLRLQQHGIASERVMMDGATVSREAYLARYAGVDVMLDTFPYPGVTTTCEALWMGVPTINLAGDTLLSRQGAGVLTPAGLGDWVVRSEAEYVDKAIGLTGELPKLAVLRSGLRGRVLASPVYDARRFARNFEDALWGMWRARSAKLGLASFQLSEFQYDGRV